MNNEKEPPKRKRDPDKTRRLLTEAVGHILVTKGYPSFSAREVANTAGVDKKLINYYFGSLNNLLKTYIHEKDFWMPVFRDFTVPEDPKAYIIGVLKEQFEYFLQHKDMQRFIHWQISEYHPVISSVSMMRESEIERILEMCRGRFKGSPVNLNAVIAILAAGIYCIVLQNNTGNGPVCGIDISRETHRRVLMQAIEQILGWAWEAAGLKPG